MALIIPGAERLAASGRSAMFGSDVTHQQTKDRPIGLVLQRFGVYPHMTAYANIAFRFVAGGSRASISVRV